MTKITADDLFFKDGKAFLSVTKGAKGGKARTVEIMGASEEETKDIIKFIQSKKGDFSLNYTQTTTIIDTVVHTQCACICTTPEKEKDIPRVDRYIMRKDRAGEVFDKSAMRMVTKNLGHNRIDVIAQSYLYQ